MHEADRCPVQFAKSRTAPETIVNGRYSSSPHEQKHSEIVQLIPQCCYFRTVVGQYMVTATLVS